MKHEHRWPCRYYARAGSTRRREEGDVTNCSAWPGFSWPPTQRLNAWAVILSSQLSCQSRRFFRPWSPVQRKKRMFFSRPLCFNRGGESSKGPIISSCGAQRGIHAISSPSPSRPAPCWWLQSPSPPISCLGRCRSPPAASPITARQSIPVIGLVCQPIS